MKINKLTLENFRCFEHYEINFSDRFTLLIGDNGSGKTAVLDSIKLALSPYIPSIPDHTNAPQNVPLQGSDNFSITLTDIRYQLSTLGQSLMKEPVTLTFINANGTIDGVPLKWSISNKKGFLLESEMPLTIMGHGVNLKYWESSTYLPIVAYYGTGRLWKENIESVDTSGPGSRLLGYKNCLTPSFNLKQLFSWFKTQELAALQKNEIRHVLEAVRGAIIKMVPGGIHAQWDLDWDELLIETVIQGESQKIPFHLLSDGYRNLICMVADISYRMATLNPQFEFDALKQTEGIVLIDEIDLHLHPKWQREVVGRLMDIFPKVQFVASSHSPFIIQSLYDRDDVLLWDLEKEAPVTIDSKSIEDIAENQQGVEIPQQSQRFLAMEKAAEEYYTVLKQLPPASEEEKQRLRQRLDQLLMPYSDDPAFQAFLKMERQAVEGRLEE
jgi:predicted ATP-binding protein involved in virulence